MTGGWPIEDRVNSGPTGQHASPPSMEHDESGPLKVRGGGNENGRPHGGNETSDFLPRACSVVRSPRNPGSLVDNR